MNAVESIFDTLGNIAEKFGALLSQVFNAIVGMLTTTTGEGAEAVVTISPLGAILLISVATGLFIWAFNYLRKLIKVRG